MEVKICGITTLQDALLAIRSGADYLGIILVPNTKRYLDNAEAFKLIQKLKDYPVHVVGVFVEKDYEKLSKRARELNLDWIQIIAPKLKTDLYPLNNFKKLLVVPVNKDGSYTPITYSLDEGDQWLYDCKTFGEGKSFDWDQFKREEEGPFLVAGGLSPQNVFEAIEKFKPNGVDVSTGVCDKNGIKKDSALVKQFIKSAR